MSPNTSPWIADLLDNPGKYFTWEDMTPDQRIVATLGQDARKYLRVLSVDMIERIRNLPEYTNFMLGPTPVKFFEDWTRCDLICRCLIADVDGR